MNGRYAISPTVVLAVLFTLCFVAVAPTFADQLTAADGLVTGLCFQTNSGRTPVVSASCSAGYSNLDTHVALSEFASSSADYGLLRAFASLSLSSLQGNAASAQFGAQATWDDTLTINNLNQDATLRATISLAGVSVANCNTVPFVSNVCGIASVEYYAQFNNGSQVTNCILGAVGSCTVFIPIIPFNGSASSDFYGFVSADVSADIFGIPAVTSPVAKYNDTAMVDSLLLVDANGNPIQGATIISASGTDYNSIAPTATPEPSCLLLLGAGLLGLAVRSSKRTVFRSLSVAR